MLVRILRKRPAQRHPTQGINLRSSGSGPALGVSKNTTGSRRIARSPPRRRCAVGRSARMLGTADHEAQPMLGRRREQELLMSLLANVTARGHALVLRGEPGIGKSCLLSATAAAARRRGMAVLTTAGVHSETHLPFAGLHQLLRPVRERATELPDAQRAALDAAFGLTDHPAPGQFRIAMAALDLLSDVATDAPLLVVVEDAHWLDRP